MRRSPQSTAPDVDSELVRRLGELLASRREEVALESSLASSELAAEIEKVVARMNEASARAGGVFEKMVELMPELGEARRLAEEKRHQSEVGEGRSLAPSNENEQKPVQRQERSKQQQRERAKKCDKGMEL